MSWSRLEGRKGDAGPERRHLVRLRTLAIFVLLFWLLLVARVSMIQLGLGGRYARKARWQHYRKVSLEAGRGKILDRDGKELAINLSAPSFALNPSDVDRPRSLMLRFASALGRPGIIPKGDLKGKSFVWLARKVDGEAAKKIRSRGLKGIIEVKEAKRYYPFGPLAGQLLGYTDIDNRGIEGVEFGFDDILRGTPGWEIVQVDARGRRIYGVDSPSVAPQDGSDLVLTICAEYQMVLEEEVARAVEDTRAEGGVGIIMNPRTGEVLAMANVPTYDPNDPGAYPAYVRRNRAVTDVYEPGSTFKIVAASAALELGIKSPEDSIFCENGAISVGGSVMRDAHRYGWLTFREVIEHSSNIGVIKIATELGPDVLYRYIRAFGFGGETGIELPGESKGIVRHPSKWSRRSLATISIGQEVSVTPLQLAAAYSAVANGGVLMRPQIVRAVVRPDGRTVREFYPQAIRRVISEETAGKLTEFLVGVVERGTGVKARIDGVPIAGKTGTAQKPDPNGGGYLPGKFVSSFVGFLPAYDPELLCLIVIDSPRGVYWGSEVAAPAFRRVISRILNLRGTFAGWPVAEPERDGSYHGDSLLVKVPEVRKLPREAAARLLRRKGLRVEISGRGDIVIAQSISPWESVSPGTVIRIDCGDPGSCVSGGTVTIPSVIGMSLREAISILALRGIEAKVHGSGVVKSQSPKPGSRAKRGAVCLLRAWPNR